ncbi:hypothetical protein AKJ16_DCAP26663 [Drosera capensis]
MIVIVIIIGGIFYLDDSDFSLEPWRKGPDQARTALILYKANTLACSPIQPTQPSSETGKTASCPCRYRSSSRPTLPFLCRTQEETNCIKS